MCYNQTKVALAANLCYNNIRIIKIIKSHSICLKEDILLKTALLYSLILHITTVSFQYLECMIMADWAKCDFLYSYFIKLSKCQTAIVFMFYKTVLFSRITSITLSYLYLVILIRKCVDNVLLIWHPHYLSAFSGFSTSACTLTYLLLLQHSLMQFNVHMCTTWLPAPNPSLSNQLPFINDYSSATSRTTFWLHSHFQQGQRNTCLLQNSNQPWIGKTI